MVLAGETSDSLFLLTEGALDVHIPVGDREKRVATIHAPALVGFMALATAQPRSASLYAAEATRLFEIGGQDFAALAAESDDLMDALAEVSAEMALSNDAARRDALSEKERAADMASMRSVFRKRLKDLVAQP